MTVIMECRNPATGEHEYEHRDTQTFFDSASTGGLGHWRAVAAAGHGYRACDYEDAQQGHRVANAARAHRAVARHAAPAAPRHQHAAGIGPAWRAADPACGDRRAADHALGLCQVLAVLRAQSVT